MNNIYDKYRHVTELFCIPLGATDITLEKFGGGHIHKTYALTLTAEGRKHKYILQEINTVAFTSPRNLMENTASLCLYLKEKIKSDGGDYKRETRTVVQAKSGEAFAQDKDGAYWRMFKMIRNTVCYDTIQNSKMFSDSGYAFGKFQSRLSAYPADTLHEIIKDFHNTPIRYENLISAVTDDVKDRAKNAHTEIDFAKEHKNICGYITERLADGTYPLRVTHNDTKLNNVLFDRDTSLPVCVIDLDTVMPGSMLYDFGDAIRYGASSATENEQDLDKVYVDLELYEAFTRGFLTGVGDSITKAERDGFYYGSLIITLECGMRFLTDYLQGDVYFNTSYPEENLHRARTQFKLVSDMEKKKAEMIKIVENI